MTTTQQPAAPPEPERAAPPLVLPGAQGMRTTRYSDVCGGTDEFKRFLTEEAATAAGPDGRETLRQLLEDGMYMLARMETRLRQYQALRDVLAGVAAQMRTIDEPRLTDAMAEAERIRALLAEGDGHAAALPARELVERAEEIRQVANDMEGALRRHKDAALGALRACRETLGQRDGAAGEDEATPAWIPEAWLPPPPHKELIVDWLKRGRATLLSDEETAGLPAGPQGKEPWVQFEDGGVMPLRVVRWDAGVRNFHPLGIAPHPRGALYRKRQAGPDAPPD